MSTKDRPRFHFPFSADILNYDSWMLSLPLPEPWTIETLPRYIDKLAEFIEKYGDIARYISHDVFTKGLPVKWVPEYTLAEWLDIVTGECKGPFDDPFADFVYLSRALPLVGRNSDVEQSIESNHYRMSAKKAHEVDTMVAFVAQITQAHSITAKSVLDVGSGLGYLSTALSNAGYQVLGVEGDRERAERAAEQNTFRSIHKMVKTYEDLDIMEDPCISLSLRTSFRYFTEIRCLWRIVIQLLINVGCCYNLLSHDGFPLSQCFRERDIRLDQPLRHLAVQATHRWTTESLELTTRKHFYRALLQVLLNRHNLSPVVGKMRPGVYRNGFEHYVRKVVEKLRLPPALIEDIDTISGFTDEKIVAAICIRAMCASVIETIILLDRWLFVQEKLQNGYVGLHRVFNAEISPRCWAIVAAR